MQQKSQYRSQKMAQNLCHFEYYITFYFLLQSVMLPSLPGSFLFACDVAIKS